MEATNGPLKSAAPTSPTPIEAAPSPESSGAVSAQVAESRAVEDSPQAESIPESTHSPGQAEVAVTEQAAEATTVSTADPETADAAATLQNVDATAVQEPELQLSVAQTGPMSPEAASAAAGIESQQDQPSLLNAASPDAALSDAALIEAASPDAAAATPAAHPPSAGDAQGLQSPLPAFANTTFAVPTEKWRHQQAVPLGTTAAEIKHSLCSNWNIPETALSVKYAGRELVDSESLSSCGVRAGADIEVELVIHYQYLATSHAKRKAEPAKAALPERFEVKVFQGPGSEAKTVTVRVDVTQKQRKGYQGGYKDKRKGALYHHADSQTDKQASGEARAERFERECQTVATRQRGGQTHREAHVQMARPDLLLDTSRDRFMSPRKYVTADEVWAVKEQCSRTIQRFTRGWLARIRVRFMLREARQGSAAASKAAAETADEETALKRFEAQRRLQPRSPADFALLQQELAAWHRAETARIKAAELSPEERHLAFCHLLHQETKLLQSVDRLKGDADVVRHEQRIAGALASMATPKQWSLSNGGLLNVHTPATTRAAELRGLYRGLQLELGAGERLDVLLHIKHKVKDFDSSLTRELLQLIEREADLINRGRKSVTMEGLRKRIATLFLQLIEMPAFNPEAGNFFNLDAKTCSSETYMYGGMTAADKTGLAVHSLLV